MTAAVLPLSSEDPRSRDPQLEELVAFVGYRPNALLTMARKPGLLTAVLGLVNVTVRGDGLVSPELRFLLACEASRVARCFYSATHAVHAAHHVGIPWSKLAELDRYLVSEHYAADERAALAIATSGGALPAGSAHEAFSTARQFFTDDQLVEIVAAVAAFGWFNRWNSLMRSELEDVPAEALQHVPWLRQLNPEP